MDVFFEPLFHVHGGRATHSSRRDGLLVSGVNHVACGENAGNGGHRVFFVNDVAVLIGFHLVAEEVGDGGVPDGDERPRGFNGFRASILCVFEDGAAEPLLIGKPFLDLPEGANLNFWMVRRSFVHDGGCLEDVSAMNQRHFAGKSGEERGFLASRIASANDQHMLVSKERPVTGCAGGNASAFLFGLTGCVQPQRFGAGADDDGLREEGFTLDHHLVGALAQVHLVNVFVLNFQAKPLRLFPKLHHHFRSSNAFGVAREIFDIAGQHQLTAGHVAGKHEGFEHGSSRIEASGVACRSRTDDDDVVHFRHVTLQASVRSGGV